MKNSFVVGLGFKDVFIPKMYSSNKLFLTATWLFLILYFVSETGAIPTIAKHPNGFCFQRIPKKSIAGNCTSDDHCRELLDYSVNGYTKCGIHGECQAHYGPSPQQEYCKDACEHSPCGKVCAQEYRTNISKYCIESRDHPNVVINVDPNRFICMCITPHHTLSSDQKLHINT